MSLNIDKDVFLTVQNLVETYDDHLHIQLFCVNFQQKGTHLQNYKTILHT